MCEVFVAIAVHLPTAIHNGGSMDGILFFLFWIGGATIHTIIELRCKLAKVEKIAKTDTGASKRGYEGDFSQ